MKYLKSINDFKNDQKNESVYDLDLNANEIGIIEDELESEDDSEDKKE